MNKPTSFNCWITAVKQNITLKNGYRCCRKNKFTKFLDLLHFKTLILINQNYVTNDIWPTEFMHTLSIVQNLQ